MSANFVALVDGFKLEHGAAFVLSCEPFGLGWLRNQFGALASNPAVSFSIGDGAPIESDSRCVLSVASSIDEGEGIVCLGPSRYLWRTAYAAMVADQLESLFASNLPGHQYLRLESGEYRTVVVTKGEYTADMLRQMRDKGPRRTA